MMGPFCSGDFNNDEEYRSFLKRKTYIFSVLAILGIITLAVSLIGRNYLQNTAGDSLVGFLEGIGIGLMIAGGVLIIRNQLLLKDKKRLRESRISNSDERNKQISISATKAALFILLITMYLTMIIGGIFYPELIKIITALIALFIISYLVAYKIFSGRM